VANLAVGDRREVDIGPIAHGGHAVAHTDGATVFVRHALPGERVVIEVTELNRRIVRADAVEILQPSADRIAPACPWSGACGGCDFQHVSMPAQRALKTQVLREALVRFGHLSADDPLMQTEVASLPGSPDGLRWRTRVTWATDHAGRRGLRRHRSHDVVPVDDCLIAVEGVSRPGDAVESRPHRTVLGRTWRLSAESFWQVHPALPEALVNCVLEFGEPAPGESWWDLYSGAGLFSAFLAPACAPGRVDAVESHPAAVREARRALHDLPDAHLRQADVLTWLRGGAARPVAGVVLDPPRAGAGAAVVEAIADRGPRVIVYVACDPVALARDVALFADRGYRLDRLRAFDAFPMTHHFESVARLAPMTASP
jgi:tRNA/tmRNA/rRNA uracil-C5-methylase (TrmA/RlmC/RlmD family)